MKRFDFVLLAAIILIILAGLATLYSIGVTSGESIFSRQLLALGIGLAVFFTAAFLDYRAVSQYARFFYVLAVVLLIAVLFIGGEVRGSNRWIPLGGFNLQPVEFAKIALILVLAKFFTKKRGEVRDAKVLTHSVVFMLILMVLVLLQPDLGSAIMLFAIWATLLIFTPVKKKHIAVLLVLLLLVGAAGWYGFLHDYQKDRILTFVNPEADPQGTGYNVRQSIIAVGSGEFLGRGLGRGFQSHLKFLPERHTDFIFASFAEELGFLGSSLLLVAFGLMFWRLILIARRSADSLGFYLVLGVAALIIIQVFINTAMNIGLMPVTGITLPLVSYGGSSLISP